MQTGRARTGSASDVGHRRSVNEDALLEDEHRRLFVVADGMGGHAAGETASREAVTVLDEALSDAVLDGPDLMRALAGALIAAHEAVMSLASQDHEKSGMGTTAVVAHLDEGRSTMTCAHIGDSRAYVLRADSDRRLIRITEDHVRGVQGVRRLTQAIGVSRVVEPEAAEVPLHPGDRVLLCTDGLTDMLGEAELREVLGGGADAQGACDELIARALDEGGVDNITCIVIDV